MSLFILEDDNVLPDYRELEDLPVPEASLDGRIISFDQMRHELDQPFESDAIPDMDVPELIARSLESASYVYRH